MLVIAQYKIIVAQKWSLVVLTLLFYSLKIFNLLFIDFLFPFSFVVLNTLLKTRSCFLYAETSYLMERVYQEQAGRKEKERTGKEISSAPFYHNCNYPIPFLKEINDAERRYLLPRTRFPSLTCTYSYLFHKAIINTDLPANLIVQRPMQF